MTDLGTPRFGLHPRDTYVRTDGAETIIREYTLTAAVDAEPGAIADSRVTPRVLPWQECPGAASQTPKRRSGGCGTPESSRSAD